jgi:hypothetical protein
MGCPAWLFEGLQGPTHAETLAVLARRCGGIHGEEGAMPAGWQEFMQRLIALLREAHIAAAEALMLILFLIVSYQAIRDHLNRK